LEENMTQLEKARRGLLSEEMKIAAAQEGVEAEVIRQGMVEGTIVICRNVNHAGIKPLAIGRGLCTKVNANIGTSRDNNDLELELEKMRVAEAAGADAVMDLSTGGALARFLAECPFDDLDWHRCDAVLPVPLHKKRLRERGFNQSLLLARALGRKYGIAVDFSLLKRRKFTLTQTGLTRQEREKNIKGAFETARPGQIADKNLILVDDVYTTGATVNECARILKHSGAADVAVVTLARVI
jgi:ComF family protein